MLKSFEDYRCGLFGFSDEVLYQNSLKDSAVNAVNRLSEYIASSLIQTCGWKSNEIAFLGVGQGGEGGAKRFMFAIFVRYYCVGDWEENGRGICGFVCVKSGRVAVGV